MSCLYNLFLAPVSYKGQKTVFNAVDALAAMMRIDVKCFGVFNATIKLEDTF
jgi:hypothetical protein